MRVTLNLATRPFVDTGPIIRMLRIGIGVLAGIAVLLMVGLHLFHRQAEEARAREHAVDTQITAIAAERQNFQSVMHQPSNAEVLSQVAALNRLFDEKSFSWTLAMEDLERVLPAGVQVSTLEPIRAKDGTITLHLRVLGPRDRAVELVRNLEHSRRFLLPRISGESSETQEGAGAHEALQPVSASNRVNFDILADYNTSAAPEAYTAPAAGKPTAGDRAASAQVLARTTASAAAHAAHPAPVDIQQYSGIARPSAALHQKPRAGEPK